MNENVTASDEEIEAEEINDGSSLVAIESRSPFVLADVATAAPIPLRTRYYRPTAGTPPFPAVVVSEGLGGLKYSRECRYGRALAPHGVATLVLDSFGSRGYGDLPDPVRALRVTETMMLADAFAGLAWLCARPEIDAARIVHTGLSYGGMVAILTAYAQLARLFVAGTERFAAHVSLYGPTVPRLEDYRTTGAPVSIMNGALDRNCNETRLGLIAGDLKEGGSAVTSEIYEGTYHQWDGDDAAKRWIPFNVAALGTRVTPDNAILDERSGRTVTGFWSRCAMLAGSVSVTGYSILRNADATERSDRVLLAAIAGTARPAAARAVIDDRLGHGL